MKKVIANFLVLLLCLVGLGLGLPPSMAEPTVAYDFLANAANATWNTWIAGTAKPLDFGAQYQASNGSVGLNTFRVEDGTYGRYLFMATPMGGSGENGITGDYYHIYIPANASLHVVFGLEENDMGEKGIVWGVNLGEDNEDHYHNLIQATKDYDGTLSDVTADLSEFGGKTGGFGFFVSTPHPDDTDLGVWVKAVLEVTSPEPIPTPSESQYFLALQFYIGDTTYFVDTVHQTMDTAPVIVESRTFLPIRYVAQELGATVAWYPPDKVEIKHLGNTIELWIGQNSASVNGSFVLIDPGNPNVVPFIQAPGRTMMPLRFISENLGAKVDWLPPQEARITYPAP